MTLKYERKNAVNDTRDFLIELLDPALTPRIPLAVRRRASSLLRHYPSEYYMNAACEGDMVFASSFDDEMLSKTEIVAKRNRRILGKL